MPRAEIAIKQATYTLLQLHAELGGKIDSNKREAERLAASMRHVEAVIRMLSPGFDTRRIAVKRRNRKNRWFKRGTMFRAVLGTLKQANAPLSAREIAIRLLAERGVPDTDRKAVDDLESGVRAALKGKHGCVLTRVEHERPTRWALAT